MAVFETVIRSDLQKPLTVQKLSGYMFSADNQGNKISVDVYDGGSPATLSGNVMGYVIRADGATVVISGNEYTTLSGNRASIILPASAYVVVGVVSIVIKVGTTTVGACSGYVYRTSTDEIVDPGHVIPSIEELLAKIADCEAATTAANTAAANANTKAALADEKATAANTAATNANTKAALADEKATAANTAATNANTKAALADEKATAANTAATNANTKAALADEKATAANTAASSANTAATNANTKAALADEKATAANTAAGSANSAASSANSAASAANTAAGKIDNMTVAASGLAAGESPTATISEVSGHKHIAFGIPKGDTGATPDFSIGTVQTLSPGSSATASITGTAESPLLNLGIPKGDTGAVENVYGTTVPMSPDDSTKVSTAIDAKVDKVSGKQLSTEDYTSAEKTKLAGIATGATANVVSDSLSDTSTTNALSAAKGKELNDKINKFPVTAVSITSLNGLKTHISSMLTNSNNGDIVYDHINFTSEYTESQFKASTRYFGIFNRISSSQGSALYFSRQGDAVVVGVSSLDTTPTWLIHSLADADSVSTKLTGSFVRIKTGTDDYKWSDLISDNASKPIFFTNWDDTTNFPAKYGSGVKFASHDSRSSIIYYSNTAGKAWTRYYFNSSTPSDTGWIELSRITGITMNGNSKGTSGTVDLGTVLAFTNELSGVDVDTITQDGYYGVIGVCTHTPSNYGVLIVKNYRQSSGNKYCVQTFEGMSGGSLTGVWYRASGENYGSWSSWTELSTITGISMNGASQGTSGVVDLGGVYKYGDFANTDLNTVITAGQYGVQGGCTNLPSDAGGYGYLFVGEYRRSHNNHICQLFIGVNSSTIATSVYFRACKVSGSTYTWGDWIKLANDSEKVSKSGGTMTGDLHVEVADTADVFATNTTTQVSAILESSSSGNHGIWSTGYYNNSTYTANGKWMLFRDANGSVTLNGDADTLDGHHGSYFFPVSGGILTGALGTPNVHTAGIEFNKTTSSSTHGGYIDFHYNGASGDFTSRIIEDASYLYMYTYDANGNSRNAKLNKSNGTWSADHITGVSNVWSPNYNLENLGSNFDQAVTFTKNSNSAAVGSVYSNIRRCGKMVIGSMYFFVTSPTTEGDLLIGTIDTNYKPYALVRVKGWNGSRGSERVISIDSSTGEVKYYVENADLSKNGQIHVNFAYCVAV